jgi:hypothetical protein
MNNPCCLCTYYKKGVEDMRAITTPEQREMGMVLMQPYTDMKRGHCHRHAPFTLSGGWPVVGEMDSCGDFQLY